jgi:hypothetical protein
MTQIFDTVIVEFFSQELVINNQYFIKKQMV